MKISILLLACLVYATAEDAIEFSYDPDDEDGPDEWANLNFDDGATNECAGDQQSPVALVKSSSCDGRADYTLSATTTCEVILSITSTGLTGDFPDDCEGIPTAELPGGVSVPATQFNVHVTSEHTIGGTTYDAELQIVHSDNVRCVDGSGTVVVALFLHASGETDNAVFGDLLNGWRNIAGNTLLTCGLNDDNGQLEEQSYNIYDLVPSRPHVLQYSGSLTTPPCLQTVDWYVIEPVAISASQLEQLQSLTSDYYNDETCKLATASYNDVNECSIQALNDRTVQRSCPPRNKVTMLGVFLVSSLVALFLLVIVC
jgi:carbonic anhydrase